MIYAYIYTHLNNPMNPLLTQRLAASHIFAKIWHMSHVHPYMSMIYLFDIFRLILHGMIISQKGKPAQSDYRPSNQQFDPPMSRGWKMNTLH